MSTPCPNCQRVASCLLDSASHDARVDYYRCSSCGHVWNVPKDDPQAEPRIVVQGREPTTSGPP